MARSRSTSPVRSRRDRTGKTYRPCRRPNGFYTCRQPRRAGVHCRTSAENVIEGIGIVGWPGCIAEDRKGFLFRTSPRHSATVLTDRPLTQANAWLMIRRRAKAAGIAAPIGCHTFRATGITAYLANGGALEHAQEMAAHESPRTTKLYDRTKERLTQDEVERIRL